MAWYPGSEGRADAFKHAGAGAEELGQPLQNGRSASAPATYIPWLFRAGLSPHEVGASCPMPRQSQPGRRGSTYIPWLLRAGLAPHEVAPHALWSAPTAWQTELHLASAGLEPLQHRTDVSCTDA